MFWTEIKSCAALLSIGILLQGCFLETGSDEGPSNAGGPTAAVVVDRDAQFTHGELIGLLPGTRVVISSKTEPALSLELDAGGEFNLAAAGLAATAVRDLVFTPSNSQENQVQGFSTAWFNINARIQRCDPAAGDNPQILRVSCRESAFLVVQNDQRVELWSTDGSVEYTERLIRTDRAVTEAHVNNGYPIADLKVLGNTLLFMASSEAQGSELWVSDGTPEGTRILMDINPNNAEVNLQDRGSFPGAMTVVGDWMYFTAGGFNTGRGLWRTDGRRVERVADVDPMAMKVSGDYIYFTAGGGVFDQSPAVLHQLHGETGEIAPVLDISADGFTGTGMAIFMPACPQCYFADGEQFYFPRHGQDGHFELWRLPAGGDEAEAVRIFSESWLHQHFDDMELYVSGMWYEAALNGIAYFTLNLGKRDGAFASVEAQFGTNDIRSVTQLWRTDGTSAGTYPVTAINPDRNQYYDTPIVRQFFHSGLASVQAIDNRLYVGLGVYLSTTGFFQQGFFQRNESSLRIYDPQTETVELPEINLRSPDWGWGNRLGDKFVVVANMENERNLWVTDGSVGGTRTVQRTNPIFPDRTYDIYAGFYPAEEAGRLNDKVLIYKQDTDADFHVAHFLWISDTTPEGTLPLAEFSY